MRILALIGATALLLLVCTDECSARYYHYHGGRGYTWGYGAAPTPYGWGNGSTARYASPVLENFERNEDRRRRSLPDSAFIQNYSWSAGSPPGASSGSLNAAAPARRPTEFEDYGQAYDDPRHTASLSQGDYYSAPPRKANPRFAEGYSAESQINQAALDNAYAQQAINRSIQSSDQSVAPQAAGDRNQVERRGSQGSYIPSFDSEFFPSRGLKPDSATSSKKEQAH